MTIFRVRFEIAGGHIHCRLFAAPGHNMTFAKCGDFVVRKGAEFRDLLAAFDKADFVGDDPAHGVVEACSPFEDEFQLAEAQKRAEEEKRFEREESTFQARNYNSSL